LSQIKKGMELTDLYLNLGLAPTHPLPGPLLGQPCDLGMVTPKPLEGCLALALDPYSPLLNGLGLICLDSHNLSSVQTGQGLEDGHSPGSV
jgi:hypothetical protein